VVAAGAELAERSQLRRGINSLSRTSVEVAVQAGEMLAKLVLTYKIHRAGQEITASKEQASGTDQIAALQELNQVISERGVARDRVDCAGTFSGDATVHHRPFQTKKIRKARETTAFLKTTALAQ
jgi:hypothetical protein